MLVTATTGQASATWIKPHYNKYDGRRSWKALQDHFAGEGSRTSSLQEAEKLRTDLHYKGENAMPFETFLNKAQQMFNLFEKHGDPISDDAKVRWLFSKVQNPNLTYAIEALRAKQTSGDAVTYTLAATHLTTSLSALPSHLKGNFTNRNVSSLTRKQLEPPSAAILDDSGNVKTGYHKNYASFSKSDKEHIRLANRKGKQGKQDKFKQMKNQLNQMKDSNQKLKARISAISATKRTPDDANGTEVTADDITVTAGDAFGGKSKKAKFTTTE